MKPSINMSVPVELHTPYTTFFMVRYPPFPGDNFMRVIGVPWALKGSKLNSDYRVLSAGWWGPEETAGQSQFPIPPEANVGRGKPWVFFVQWEKISETNDYLGQASVADAVKIVGVALAFLLTFTVISKMTVQDIKEIGKGVGDTLKETVFNPGVIVAVLLGFWLFLRR